MNGDELDPRASQTPSPKSTPPVPSDEGAMRLLGAARTAAPGVGESLGPFELVAEIGRGSASAVFRARQRQPVAREVAVKVLVDPSPSANVAARFRRERSLLARLRHRGVVPLIDAGETQATESSPGVPWFAMPLVEGEPIDRWCDRHAASRAVRLKVLEDAARAVGAAHALGIVHRDLKPGNILVSGPLEAPEVFVIDFGIAKVLDDGLLDGMPGDSIGTRVGAVVGTPEFMSPEQANLDGALVGPASDVYALGLVACLLLAGRAPGIERTSVHSRPAVGVRLRAAADRVVPPLSELAGDRAWRGEVEWIVGACCAQDSRERYRNANALADDLERLRERRPIVAAPRDSGYEVSYALRKHRGTIVLASAALAVAVGSLAYSASRESARADAEQRRSEQMSKALEKARVQLIPLTGKNRGDVVGDPAKAVEVAEALYAVNQAVLGATANETQQSALVLARAYDRVDRHRDAEPLFRDLLAQAMTNDERMGDRAYLRSMLAGCLRRQGVARAEEALQIFRDSLAWWEEVDDQRPTRADVEVEMAMVLDQLKRFDEARGYYERGAERHSKLLGAGHIRSREARSFLADHHRERGRFEEARALYASALDGMFARTVPGTPESADPSRLHADRWRDAWEGELSWLSLEEARASGRPGDAAELKSLRENYDRTIARDPAHNRLPRWRATLVALGALAQDPAAAEGAAPR
jgi:serine/threonine protein kinase